MTPRHRRSQGRTPRSSGPNHLHLGLTVLATVLLWLFLGPVQLGGATAYSVISGNSMEPLLHKGDLVAVRQGKSYRVGDIALYRSKDLKGQRVLHRILAVGDRTYTFKGDNNDFVDPETVPATALEGRLWFHGSHVGSAMTWIREPWRAALIAAVAAAIALGSKFGRTTRRRRRHAPPQHTTGAREHRAGLRGLWAPAAAGLVVVLAVAGAGFTKPLTTSIAKAGAFRHEGTFSYEAKLRDPNPAFPSGAAETGQPVFFALSDAVRLTFDYRFVSTYAHDVKGTIALKALISDSTGWREVFDVGTPVSFGSGDHATVGGVFPLDTLRVLVAQLATNSGLPTAEYPLYLQPVVTVTGRLAGRPLTSTFSPVLPISLTQSLLKVVSSDAAAVPGATAAVQADVFHPVLQQTASVDGPNTLTIARYHVAIHTVRLLSFILFGGWIIALLVLVRRARVQLDDVAIAATYGDTIVPVGSLHELSSLPTVPVVDFEDLARLASELEEPLLAETVGSVVRYAVVTSALVYLYEPIPRHEPFAELPPGPTPPATGATGPRHGTAASAPSRSARSFRLPSVGRSALQFGPLLVPLVVLGSIVMSFTATSVMPTSYAGLSTQPLQLTQLAPRSCGSVALVRLVVATGATTTGTAGADLVLGRGSSGAQALNGAAGNDCIVAGGTASTTNAIDGGSGTDMCMAPAASKTTFKNCEVTLAT